MRDKPWFAPVVCALGLLALVYNLRAYSALWTTPKQESDSSAASDAGAKPQASHGASAVPVRTLAALDERDLVRAIAALPPSSRDPFQFSHAEDSPSGESSPAARPALVLQGTLVGRRRVAWINQRALSEGDQIGDQRVERIEADRVVLRRGDEEYELWPSH